MFVKICGITRESDALLAVAMGADAVGFNFVPGSRRQIAPTIARDIARSHGGDITFEDSPMGGARVVVSVPA